MSVERQHVGEQDELAQSLVAYLDSRPRAADTLEGIVSWWLPLQRYAAARSRIEETLSVLVDFGLLRRDRLADGTEIFALKRGDRNTKHS